MYSDTPTPHNVANIVSSVAITSSQWKNWWGLDKKWGPRLPRPRPRTATVHMTQLAESTSKTHTLSKKLFGPLFGDTKDIATKSGETHVWDRSLPSCKCSYRSARDICARAKNTYFFLYGTRLEGYRLVLYIESPRRADFKLWLTCNAATYRFSRYSLFRGSTFWILEIPWGYRLKRGDGVRDRHEPSCKISRGSVLPSPRYDNSRLDIRQKA